VEPLRFGHKPLGIGEEKVLVACLFKKLLILLQVCMASALPMICLTNNRDI
jgi:hypothetical protein